MGWNFVAFLLYYWSIFSVVFVSVYGSSPKILSVTRSRDKGDSFEVNLESASCRVSCEQYGAVNGGTRSITNYARSGCSCHCANKTRPTFYRTHLGQHRCVEDGAVLADAHGKTI